MKPLRLVFQGLHSYRDEAVVDFEKLGERGLFGIFGPTGAGKSTILDAVTLALYGVVERVQGGKRLGIAHPEADEVRTALRFEGAAGARYEVERSYRAREDGSIDGKAARLKKLEDGAWRVVAEKTGTVDAEIERVVGLDSENFRRVVVLPQGKFAEFLQLTGARRRAMLETILKLERFGEGLFRKVADRRRAVASEVDQAQAILQELAHATAAALEQAEADRDGRRRGAAEAEAALQKLTLALVEARAVRVLEDEVRTLEAEQARHLSRAEQIEAQRQELALAQRAEPLRSLLEEEKKLAEDRAGAEAAREAAEDGERSWVGKLASAQGAQQAAEAALAEGKPRLLARRDELKEAEKLEAEVASLARPLQDAERERAEVERSLRSAEAERARLAAARKAGDEELARLAGELARCQVDPAERARVLAASQALRELEEAGSRVRACASKSAARQASAALAQEKAAQAGERAKKEAAGADTCQEREAQHRAAAPGEEKGLRESARSADALDRLVESVGQADAEAQAAHRAEAEAVAREAALAEADEAASRALTKAEEKATGAQAALEEGEKRDLAGQLARGLKEGAPCPVCGSATHPHLASGGVGEGEAGEVHKAWEAARQALEKAQAAAAGAKAELAVARARREEAQAQAQRTASALALCRSKLPADRREAPCPALKAWRGEERTALASKEAALDRWREQAEALAQQGREAHRAAAEASAQALAASAEAAAEARAAQESSRELAEAREKAEEKRRALDERRGALGLEAIEEERRRLEALEQQAAGLSQRLRDAEEGRGKAEEKLRERGEEAARLGARLEALAARVEELGQKKRSLAEALRAATGGQAPRTLMERCEEELRRLERALGEAQAGCQRSLEGHHRAKEQLAADGARLRAVAEQQQKAGARLRGELAAQQFDAEAAKAALRPPARREELSRLLSAYEDRLRELGVGLKGARERLGGRSQPEAALAELEARHQAAQEGARQATRELGRLEELLRALGRDCSRREEVEGRLAKLLPVLDRLDRLADMVEGRKLVEFMAEREIASIARSASERLRSLTCGRYELLPQQDDKRGAAGFVVRDNHNGGVERPVGSLSGGETFLASLAMALALSMQVQLQGGELRFFFLDEGFGTLDPATLEVALSALEKLRAEDLTVGVITHVDEVRSRLPRRLIVSPARPGGPGSAVRIEEA